MKNFKSDTFNASYKNSLSMFDEELLILQNLHYKEIESFHRFQIKV